MNKKLLDQIEKSAEFEFTRKASSKFDKMAVELLKCILPGQSMKLEDGEHHVWTSIAIDVEGISVVTIKKDDVVVASAHYNYDTSEEKVLFY